jgi:hypothetical protein
MKRSLGLVALAVMVWIGSEVRAAAQWAEWGTPSGNTVVGTFSSGHTVTLTGDFTGISAGHPAGTAYTSDPAVPGRPDDTNPPFMSLMTGPGTTLCVDGNLNYVCPPFPTVAELDLSDLPAGTSVTFGLSDTKGTFFYQLELRDAASNVLSPDDAVLTPYNITWNGSSLVADLNLILLADNNGPGGNDNILWADGDHDAGGFYAHTGLTTISNLPADTRSIRLIFPGPGAQDVEQIQIYVAADLPASVDVTDASNNTVRSLDFGSVFVGSHDQETITVSNHTAAPADISFSDPLPATSPFAIPDAGNCTVTLAVGASCSVTLVFAPLSQNASSDSFTLDLGGSPWVISLTGSGTEPSSGSGGGGGGGCFIHAAGGAPPESDRP